MVKKYYRIHTEKYKIMHFYDDTDAWELFDLAQDTYELENKYPDPTYAAIREELNQQLKELIIQYADTTVR